MNTKLTASQAMEIAREYKQKYNLRGVIHDSVERSVKFYPSFYGIKGCAWLVLVDITPNIFEGDDEITIVVSDGDGVVDHVIDHNGISHYYHIPSNRDYTDEEFEAFADDENDE
ncbi:hypothetical protein [Paenibacillus durus]|uniref:Uncharacterized protein n=1 Tax=Paenibacillus durus ATCC 35681 TaxID=1333534 RepID=A0A0F7F6D3_PAEDU|nr:hypothetical protein [Paenibacillus durus]AKG33273.1 hypothetical protein VK70_00480 [Paenibacillus durus ATCC 35681]